MLGDLSLLSTGAGSVWGGWVAVHMHWGEQQGILTEVWGGWLLPARDATVHMCVDLFFYLFLLWRLKSPSVSPPELSVDPAMSQPTSGCPW